jgi:hypothetical protein
VDRTQAMTYPRLETSRKMLAEILNEKCRDRCD